MPSALLDAPGGRESALALSVIVPAFQASRTLGASIRSIRESCPAGTEIIVVDDGSFDDTLEIARRFADVVVERPCQAGAARARNDGAQVASGRSFLFVDADVTVNPTAVAGVLAHLDAGADAVFGAYEALPPPEVRTFATTYKNLLHHYTHGQAAGPAETFWSGFGAVRRDAFLTVAGFDPKVTTSADVEDIHLGYRLRARGFGIVLDPTLRVLHHKRYTIRDVVRSDVLHRAVPWTRAMLTTRTFHSDLNLRGRSMVAAAVTFAIPSSFALVPLAGPPAAVAGGSLVLVWLGLHRHVLSYFRRTWSTGGALGSAGMLYLYYVYGVVGTAMGVAAHILRRGRHAQLNWLRYELTGDPGTGVTVTVSVVAVAGEPNAALDALPAPAPWWELLVVGRERPEGLPAHATFLTATPDATRDDMRQMALEMADGEMFAALDASTVPDPGWLDCVREAAGRSFLVVAGPFHHDRRSVRHRAAQVVRFWHWRPEAAPAWLADHPPNNIAFRTAVARRLGGFKVHGALVLRFAGFGARPVRFVPGMAARFAGPPSIAPFLRGVGGTARLRASASVRYYNTGRLHRLLLVAIAPLSAARHVFRIVRGSIVEGTADRRLWLGLPLVVLGVTAHWAGRALGQLNPRKRGGLVPRSEHDLAMLAEELTPAATA